VREDEAKAAAEEEERERERIDAENKQRLDALRRRAGSPGVPDLPDTVPAGATGATQEGDPGDLPSTSVLGQQITGGLMERHRKAKARAEKEEKRRKERLDFDFPSDTARKERRRAEKEAAGSAGAKAGAARADGSAGMDGETGTIGPELGASLFDAPGTEGSMWTSGGHLNLFADLERVSRFGSIVPATRPLYHCRIIFAPRWYCSDEISSLTLP